MPLAERIRRLVALPGARALGKLAAGLFAVPAGFILTALLFMALVLDRMKEPITGAPPPSFPIVVFWRTPAEPFHARVIVLEELEAFRKAHPDVSFLLPPGRKADMEQDLDRQAEGIDAEVAPPYGTGRRMYIWASQGASAPDRQCWSVRFQYGNDHVNVGTYEARTDGVRPTHIERYFGPGLALMGCPIIVAAWAFLSWLTYFLLRLLARRLLPKPFPEA